MKLSFIKAKEIRTLYESKKYTQIDLAKSFSVSQSTISKIIRNELFRDETYKIRKITISDIISLHNKYKVSEIAIVLDCSLNKIYSILHQEGIINKNKNFGANKLNKEKAKKIRELYVSGKSIKDLSKKFNVTVASIGRIINNVTYKEEEFLLGGQGDYQIGYIF
jgi:transcriptional regulator with XRE-family HTH domain